MAGLRTNALVAIGATLFVLLSAYGFDAGLQGGVRVADPTRVAAQIVSGIGFLGAGVILRDGLNVRGLNTAATLWCSAAVGALTGAGMYSIAAFGTGAVIVANVVLRPLGRRIDRQPGGGDEVRTDYRFEAVCTDTAEAHVRALLVHALTRPEFQLRAVRSYNTDDPLFEQAVSRMSFEPDVSAVSWAAHTDADSGVEAGQTPTQPDTAYKHWRKHSSLGRNRWS